MSAPGATAALGADRATPGLARPGLSGLAVLAGIALLYVFADRPFATDANTWHHPALAIDLTFLADVPAPAAAIVLIASVFLRLPRALIAAAVATLVAIGIKDELKFAFGRTWPDTWVHDNPSWIRNHAFGFHPFHGGAGYASFPSGHMTAISAPASVLWRTVPRLRPLAVLLVLLVAAGLLAADYHFPSDVLAGAALGTAVGLGVAVSMAV